MNRQKRMISLLLCLAMLIGVFPISVLAANTNGYSDVETTDWFCEAVEYVSDAKLMRGTGAGRFRPNEEMTRGMLVTILYRLSGEPAVTGTCTFKDVAAGKYYETPVIWAAGNGIVTGAGADMFRPDAPITREQLAAILYRYARYCGFDVSVSNDVGAFKDAGSVSSYAMEAIKWANAAGLINGSGGALRPQGNATRAEVAAILMRFCKNVAEKADGTKSGKTRVIMPANPTEPEQPDEPDQPDQPNQPEQPTVTGRDAYELIWDDFMFVSANDYSVKGFSSWDCSNAMAAPKVANGGAAYTDNSEYAGIQLRRAFNATAEDLVWEFTWKAPETLNSTTIELRSGATTAIRFTMENGKLMAQENELCAVSDQRFALLRVRVSPVNSTYSVEADGETVAENLPFVNACASVDNVYIQTTEQATGTFTLSTMRMHVGYVLHEQFLNADQGQVPASWTVSGDVAAAYLKGTQGPDNYSAKMQNGAKLSRSVSYSDSGAWLEYQLLIPQTMDSFTAVLADDAGNSFKIAAENGAFGYYENGVFQKLYECEENLWYHIMFKQTPQGGMLYLNHKRKAEKLALPFEKFSTITFEAGEGTAYLDDIILKDYSDYGSDYVAAPVKPEKKAGAPLVGVQSCNLWVEGQHFGYDWLTQWDERTTYLGYYDETSAETADWELKWKIEHGIDFELFCWYRPSDSNDAPIKSNRNGTALHEGYFNARYSDQMKFAITWECNGGPVSGAQDFEENVVPYWIEQYFKDERYLVIDNKPVVGMYSVNKLMSYFGNTAAGVKKELDFLREACITAGFDGCYVIMSNNSTSLIDKVAEAGFDGQYAYCWDNPADIDNQKRAITNFKGQADATSAKIIPVASMGWDARAWERRGSGYCTAADYESLLNWISDTLMPTMDENSLGAKMVLLDNWNEYGEGHFLMPANLNGFGYLDAVRSAFTTDTAHTDVRPTAAQQARINRMYVQNREVEKVSIDDGTEKTIITGWYFEETDNLEGWTVAKWKGNDMDVQNLRQEDGCMKGGTTGDSATNYADPALDPPADAGPWNANEVAQIRVRMKLSVASDAPELYFSTEDAPSLSQSRMVQGNYAQNAAGADGFTEVIFDMSANALWSGKITGFRFDPMTKPGTFEIDSVELLGKEDLSEATVTLEGERVYTAEPVKLVNNTVLLAAEDVNLLFACRWSTTLDESALELSVTKGKFYRFSCTANEMTVNGVQSALTQGAQIIGGTAYIPLAALMESEGYTAAWDAATKTLAITKAAAPSKPYTVIKGWYFTNDQEGWMQGGALNSAEWSDDTLHATAGDNQLRLWSAENINLNIGEITHLRVRVRANADQPAFSAHFQLDNGSFTTEPVAYTSSADAFAEVLIPLTEEALWSGATQIQRICVYPFGGDATIGKEAWIDEIELVKYTGEPEQPNEPEQPAARVLKGWYFTNDVENFIYGGSTGIGQEDGALKITAGTDGQPRVWSCGEAGGGFADPINGKASEAETLRMLVKNATAGQTMHVKIQAEAADGSIKMLTYPVALPVSADSYAELRIDLKSVSGWNDTYTLKRLGLYPFGEANTAHSGSVIYFDCIEILAAPKSELEVLKEYTFEGTDNTENWAWGGGDTAKDENGNWIWGNFDGKTITIASNGSNSKIWSPQNEANFIGVNVSELKQIRLRIKTDANIENPTFKIDFLCGAATSTTTSLTGISMKAGSDGWADVTIDCTAINWGAETTLNRICIWPYNGTGVVETTTIDTVQFLGKTESTQPEEPDIPDPLGGDDGVGEVADSSRYSVLFGSIYFKNSKQGAIPGGATKLEADNGALKVTAADDGQPRFWSSGAAGEKEVVNAPLDIKASDLDYIRIRIKTTIPDQKMSVAAQYYDDEQNKTTVYYDNLPVEVSEDGGYTEVLVDLSKYAELADDLTLERVGLFPFGRSNTKYAGKALYIGSIEFLKKADPTAQTPVKILVIGNSITQHDPSVSLGWLGNWGMAATARSKDYVHLLLGKALAAGKNVELHCVNVSEYEKYFYDWSKITTDFSKYVEYDADIVIAAFGANIKNGANEGDPGYENDEIFTKVKYKEIIDHFNPGGDATIISGLTMLTTDKIAAVIQEAAEEYGYNSVDMRSDLTDELYTAKGYEAILKEKFGVNAVDGGVLNHPGDTAMQEMADRLWGALNPILE